MFKAYVGLMLQEVTIRQHYNLSNRTGLFVTKIEPDSPASRSQLEEGDIILSFNKKHVTNTQELFRELTTPDILSWVDISVMRHTELLNFSIAPVENKR